MESFGEAKTSWTRRVVFISSIVVHAGAAIGLLIWSVFHVEELAPPEVTLTFFNAPPPPPPPPPPAGATKKTSSSTKPKIVPTKKPTLIEPTVKPKDEPKEAPEEKGGGEPGGQVGGVTGGVTGGVVGGVVGAPPPTAPPPPPPPVAVAPKFVPSFVFNKDKIANPDPHLSDDFKRAHPKSSVSSRYRICVGTDGHITEVTVQQPLGGTEDDSIVRQIRTTWLWKPQPLPLCTVSPFTFNIN